MNIFYWFDPATKEIRPGTVVEMDAWGKWFEGNDRLLWRTNLTKTLVVSTVFLGIAHGFDHQTGAPILFETMAFYINPERQGEYQALRDIQFRYCTYTEAEDGHNKTVAALERELARPYN